MASVLRRSRAAWCLALLLVAAAAVFSACGGDDEPAADAQSSGPKDIVLTQPAALVEALPVWVGIDQGQFKDENLNVSLKTVATSGSSHVDAVLGDEAWGYLGGVEHVLFANEKGGDLIGLTNLNSLATYYLVASPSSGITGGSAEDLRGKTIATIAYGSTPNSVLRWYLDKIGLDPKDDVKLQEGSVDAIFGSMGSKRADMATAFDPILSIGQGEKLWGEPVVNFATELGPIGNTIIGVRKSSLEDKVTVDRFLRALAKARESLFADPAAAAAILAKRTELPAEVAKEIVDRDIAAGVFSKDGKILPEDVTNAEAVVKAAGLFDGSVPYEEAVAETAR